MSDAREILEERLARGEIGPDAFRELSALLAPVAREERASRPAPLPPPLPRRRRSRAGLWAAIVTVLLIAGLVATWIWLALQIEVRPQPGPVGNTLAIGAGCPVPADLFAPCGAEALRLTAPWLQPAPVHHGTATDFHAL